jgi:hypothetical protein
MIEENSININIKIPSCTYEINLSQNQAKNAGVDPAFLY